MLASILATLARLGESHADASPAERLAYLSDLADAYSMAGELR